MINWIVILFSWIFMEVDMRQDLGSQLKRVALDAVDNLEGVETVTEAAKYVPVQYFGVMAGKNAPDYKDGTFIVKKSNIVAIKRYVNLSLLLPVDLGAVERLLGYIHADSAGLEPRDIQALHQEIHKHALSWGTLERETKDLGGRLDLFSRGFINTGALVVDHLKSFTGYRNLFGTIDTLTPEEQAALASIPLGNSDTEKVNSLIRYLGRMKSDIENFYNRVSSVKALATEFSRKITEDLLPAINIKVRDVEAAGIEKDAKDEQLKLELKELDERIAEKLAEYSGLVGYAFTGLVFGPIGVAITGGIFGSQAERVRAEKNRMLERRGALLEQMRSANISKLMNDLAGRLIDIRTLMVDAEKGARNLEDVWAIIWLNIDESAVRLSEVDNALDLNMLVLDLQAVVEPWRVISGHARALSKVFNEVVG
ncbi:alpha-xenorhabdolysin family binary toxin subunit A [Pseudomonas sp. ZT5P21]